MCIYEDELENKMKSCKRNSSNELWNDRDENGGFICLYQEVYNLNKAIFEEAQRCREMGIHRYESDLYNKLIREGKRRFEKYNYEFTGFMFKLNREEYKRREKRKRYVNYLKSIGKYDPLL